MDRTEPQPIHAPAAILDALRSSEERIQQALLVSNSFTFEWDSRTDQVVRSASCASVLDLGGEEAVRGLGQRYFDCILDEDRDRFVATLHALTSAAPSYRTEYRILRRDGGIRVLEEVGQGSFDPSGHLLKVVGVATDITDRKRAEEKLRLRNRELNLLTRASQLLITGAATEAGLVQSLYEEIRSVFHTEMFCYYRLATPLELGSSGGRTEEDRSLMEDQRVGYSFCLLVAERRSALILEDMQRGAGQEWQEMVEAGVRCAAGFPLSAGERVLGTIAFFSRQQSHFQEGEIDTLQTICEQLATTLERTRLQRELRASEQWLALAASGTGVGMYEYEPVTGKVVWTEQHIRLLGLDPKSKDPHRDYTYQDWAARCHPEDLAGVEAQLRDCMQTGRPYEGDFRVIWPDGSVHWHSGKGLFIFDDQGLPLKVLGTTVDITDRKETELRLASALNELRLTQDELLRRERFAALGQLAGSVAHELRTPLSVMRNNLVYLKLTQPQADPETQDALAEMERAIANSDHIISEMLDFVREPVGTKVEFFLATTIHETLRSLRIPQGVQVHCDVEATTKVYGTPGQISRLLSNLFLNAIQAMPGGGELRITVDPLAGEGISVIVSDTGCGIDPGNLSKIFDPLFTTKTRGIGLGLAICQRYAKLNGGTLTVKSSSGMGTSFRLTLPSPVRSPHVLSST